VTAELATWITEERALVRDGEHPLSRWADDLALGE
jgi:hypothetical protein